MDKCLQILCGCVLVLLLLVNGGRTTPTNIARGKATASSSPSARGRNPSIVVDGVTEDSSIGGGSAFNCADCFYIGLSASAHHWRVDLENQYFITQVKVYTGKVAYTMSDVSILTRGDESPFVDPSDHPDQWNQIYSGSINGEFTKTLDTAVYARHVAVRVPVSRQLVLTEMEVYGYAVTEFKPTNLQITEVTSDCVTLTWSHPYDDKAKYQYRCGSSSWKSTDNTRPLALCRISPSAGMTCRVRVEAVAETELSTDIRCSDFTIPQPTGLSFGSPTKLKHSGRWRYRYIVTWSVPTYYTGCLHSTNPYQWKADSYSSTLHNTNSWDIIRDGGVDVTVKVWVRNETGELSSPTTKSIAVPIDIPPQVAPRNFQLTAVSPYCVSLSWDPVQYPNGPESGIVYQHNCNSNSWTTIPNNNRVCDYSPNTLVSCKIRARRGSNSVGNRDSEETGVKTVTTPCVQNPPTDLKFNPPERVTQSSRQRWKYTITWQKPETYGCIHPTNPYKIQMDSNSPVTNHNQNSYILYRDGGEIVTVRVWLRDTNGVLSDVATKSITTSVVDLPPQVAPRNFQLTAVSPYCVSLSWDPVQYPNGPENGLVYQHNCLSDDWTNIPNNNRVCGFASSTLVSCKIRAKRGRNSDGNKNSEETDRETAITCNDPFDDSSIQFNTPILKSESGRKRWKYTVSWQIRSGYNCDKSSPNYKLEIDGNTKLTNSAQTSYSFYTDGYVDVSVKLWLLYETGELSTPATKSIITSTGLPPQIAPRNFQLTAVSPYCVSLSWDSVLYPNGPDIVYQYNCNSLGWTSIPDDNKVCRFTPNTQISCRIKARRESNTVGNRDSELTDIKRVTTPCLDKPPSPNDLSFGLPTQVTQSGRKRWRYTVTWKEPEIYGCIHPTNPYKIQIDSNSPVIDHNQNSYILYRDGGEIVTVRVWLRDKNEVLSDVVTKSITTSVVNLPPQVAPRNFQLTTVSPYHVTLSWDPVQYPNGPESGIVYQYNCNSNGWTNVLKDKTVRGFTPNTLVSCKIRARRGSNSAGNRDSEETGEKTVRTPCPQKPPSPTGLSFGSPEQKPNSGRQRWKYTISWQEPETYGCIHSINQYKIQIDSNSSITNHNQNSYILYRDGGEIVTVRVRLRDKNEVLSDFVTKSITTSVVNLPPQVAPRNFQLTAVSPYCVSLSWDPVQYPNGPESEIVYQMKCRDNTWSVIPPSKQLCVYRPYELARCEIRASRESNSYGNRDSETADSSVRTHCAKPELPTDLSTYFTQNRYKPDGSDRRRIRVRFNIPGNDITINCKEIKSKEFRLKGTKDYTYNNQYINNLLPNFKYEIEVKVVNDKDLVKIVSWEITTIELEPYTAPVITRNDSYNQSCVFLGWNLPVEPNGVITRYQHRYFLEDTTPPPSWLDYGPPQTENSHISCGYKAGDLVTYQVKARTAIGYSPEATGNIRVTCGFPSIPEFQTLNETHEVAERERIRLNISWMESTPACESILYYNLTMLLKSDRFFHNKYLPTDDREMVIEDLDPYTNYTIILIAVNNALNVSSTEPRYTLTPELAPYDGPVLMEPEFKFSCVSLGIQEPTEPNGVITHYQISCDYASSETSSYTNISVTEVQPHTVCGFKSAEKIECRASAVNTAGESPTTSVTGYTRFEISSSKQAGLKNPKNSGKTVPITIYPITLDNKELSAYRFVVKKLGETSARRKRSNQVIPEPDCDLENSGGSSTCYITADVDSSLVKGDGYQFKVGDGKEYGGYLNAPLEPDQDYRLYQGVTVITEDGTERVEYFKEPIDFYLAPLCDKNCIIAVAVSLSVVILTVGAIGLFLMLRRRRLLGKTVEKDDNVSLHNIPSSPAASSASNRRRRPQPSRADLYDMVDMTFVKLPDLEEYIRQEVHIKEEYEKIKELPKPVMNAAGLTENKGKCRYRGLYPADESRVILERDGGGDTDFINASYIDGFSKTNTGYIAAQGPMKATVDDFWLMIWQQRPKAIVMVTNVLEDGKHKCEQYWPDDVSSKLTYSGLSVTLVSKEEWADFIVRVLRVEKNGESRTVRQFHYISWPDHGVPDSMCPFISFYKKVVAETYRLTAPLLVHCSAGVGRTGTFIAMTNLLEQATSEERVDFFVSVKKMRENRPSMVQTVEQYVFLHQVVNEFISTKDYICSPGDLPAKLSDHEDDTNIYSNTATGAVDAEFDRVEAGVTRHAINVTEGRSSANVSKNRDMNVLPPSAPEDPKNRHKSLRPLISRSRSDYINAVFANAYRKQNQFIATQLPLTNTLADFWQMVEDHKVCTIVQLEDTNVNERFYPSTDEEKPMHIGDFVVIRLTSETNQEVSTISLRITRDNTSRDVQLIKTESWKEDIPENSSMLCYLETLERSQQKSGNGRVCFMSLDGGARCGMFICAHNAIEKLKCEQEVDLYSTVVSARLRRPQFVARMEYYVKLYDLLREFADRFSDYANFK